MCSPSIWWAFAIHAVLRDIHNRNKRLSFNFVLRRARQSVQYVSDYTYHLTHTTVDERTKERMGQVEEELSLDELIILRRVAMQKVEQERALAEVSEKHRSCGEDFHQPHFVIKMDSFPFQC